MQFVSVNNITLHYQYRDVATDKPVIVFANSLGTDFRIWDAVVDALSAGYSALVYDKRGHGLSSPGQPPYAMADHVADIEALITHLEIPSVVICGLSVGGMIAQGLSLKRPDLVRAAILCDTGHKIGTADMWQERIAALESTGLLPMVDAVMERWFTDGFRKDDNPVYAGCKAMLGRQLVAGYMGTCAALRDADYTAEITGLKMPVLCVVGDQDMSTPPALVKELQRLIPGAEYAEIIGAGHIPCVEQPEQLISALRAFLKANSI